MLRLVLVLVSPRVAGGQLSWPAWELLRSGAPVACGDAGAPHAVAVAGAGEPRRVLDPGGLAALRALAEGAGTAVWLGGDEPVDLALADQLAALAAVDPTVTIEVVGGAVDVPGARLLDAVAVMDRLRSPGGCPWDAEQTHASLAPYLLEEAYEAFEALEDGDTAGLREELGDLLLQVLFHARLGHEEVPRWSVDDVADALVAKLVGRHPHVFGDASVDDAAHVEARWEQLKAAEKGRTSVTDGVPMAMASLALTAKLQRRAAKLGVPADLFDPGEGLGADLWRAVAGPGGAEAESALRGVARMFRDRLAAAENVARAEGLDPAALTAADWRARWRGPDKSDMRLL